MPSAAPLSTAPLLSVQDLKVHFRIGGGFLSRRPARILRAVDGVSFDLRPGETLGLVGESGCGKTTLGRAVLRLLPNIDGRVVWLGEDLAKLDPEAMRRKRQEMQIVFQDPLAALDPRMTVGEIIGEPLATFRPDLPKAEGQRIGIARAMINNPKLVVCDEPVSALDVSIQAQIVNLLMDLQQEFGMSMIFISHNLSVVRHISHRIMVLYLGRVAELASRDQLYRNPRHPYTQALISAVPIPDPDLERQKQRIVLTGDLPSPLNPPSGCAFRTRCPKATEICARVNPDLLPIESGHQVACHHWDE